MNKSHSTSSLPQWAQILLAEKDRKIDALERAHAILFEYEGWFVIHGPPSEAIREDKTYNLFFLGNRGSHPVCSLKHGDVLLCGRKRV